MSVTPRWASERTFKLMFKASWHGYIGHDVPHHSSAALLSYALLCQDAPCGLLQNNKQFNTSCITTLLLVYGDQLNR